MLVVMGVCVLVALDDASKRAIVCAEHAAGDVVVPFFIGTQFSQEGNIEQRRVTTHHHHHHRWRFGVKTGGQIFTFQLANARRIGCNYMN